MIDRAGAGDGVIRAVTFVDAGSEPNVGPAVGADGAVEWKEEPLPAGRARRLE